MSDSNLGRRLGRGTVLPRPWPMLLSILAVMLGPWTASSAEKAAKTVIADKTLVAWVAPANLTQRGGSVLTIEKSGGTFDAIVLGEMAAAKWMAGSNGFARTQKDQATSPLETADSQTLVQIAVVYQGQQITLYRNGVKYADYTAADKKLKVDTRQSSLTEGAKSIEAGPLELQADEPLKLRVFVDKSVVEVFANGRQAVMRRVYPASDSVGVKIFSNGGPASVTTLEAWDMMPSNPY